MSKKNFLSSDFFVTASEQEAKNAVCSLPKHFAHLTLLKENLLLNSLRFLFEDIERHIQYYIDVSLLPLNNEDTRFSLHVSYTNGQGIHSNSELIPILQTFEQWVQAAIKKDFSVLSVRDKSKPVAKKSFLFPGVLLSIFFSKYHY